MTDHNSTVSEKKAILIHTIAPSQKTVILVLLENY